MPVNIGKLFDKTIRSKGSAATFDAITAALTEFPKNQLPMESITLACTGDPRVLDWLEENICSPLTEQWGDAAALSGIDWPRLKKWLGMDKLRQLAALEALLSYRVTVHFESSPIMTGAKPVMPNPPKPEEVRAELKKVAGQQPTARVSRTISRIDKLLPEILRGGKPAFAPKDLPKLSLNLTAILQKALKEERIK